MCLPNALTFSIMFFSFKPNSMTQFSVYFSSYRDSIELVVNCSVLSTGNEHLVDQIYRLYNQSSSTVQC